MCFSHLANRGTTLKQPWFWQLLVLWASLINTHSFVGWCGEMLWNAEAEGYIFTLVCQSVHRGGGDGVGTRCLPAPYPTVSSSIPDPPSRTSPPLWPNLGSRSNVTPPLVRLLRSRRGTVLFSKEVRIAGVGWLEVESLSTLLAGFV